MQLKNTDLEDYLLLMIDLDWIPDDNMEALPCDKVLSASDTCMRTLIASPAASQRLLLPLLYF